MTVEEVRERLKAHSDRLRELQVESLWLFGSVARGEAGPGSDLDVIVEFEGSRTSANQYFGLLFFLEDSFGVKVDLAEPEALHPRLRDGILREAVRVA